MGETRGLGHWVINGMVPMVEALTTLIRAKRTQGSR